MIESSQPQFCQTDVSTSTFRQWEVYEVLPMGWKIDNSCGSPLHGFDFCTDGKSVLNGGKRALVRSIRKGTPRIEFVAPIKENKVVEQVKEIEDFIFPSKTVNTLARKKFQEQLLKEIRFDLIVCEIEGWDKTEYIKELQKLLNSIDVSKKKKKGNDFKQQSLFDALT